MLRIFNSDLFENLYNIRKRNAASPLKTIYYHPAANNNLIIL